MRYAVILAGGGGTRLWPASTETTPKQFLPLGSTPGESLIASTLRRVSAIAGVDGCLVVTGHGQVDGLRSALPQLAPHEILAEPARRNTAAALGLAAVHLLHRDPNAVIAALPADHHIANEPMFAQVAQQAFAVAENGDVIATIGIEPTRPETGFGYIELGGKVGDDGAHEVKAFVEKPDVATAQSYLAAGRYLWNGGMFFVRAAHLMSELQRHMPATHRALTQVAEALTRSPAHAHAAATEVYDSLPSISIDYGVMEQASNVVTFRGDFGWNDVGSWTALADYRDTDPHGNVISGDVVLKDADRNIVVTDGDATIMAIGVSDLIVVQAENRFLVVPRDRAQEVGALAKQIAHRHEDS